ncbi:hypothetical protein PRZ48_011523 [Zasmidium cellare]|uniref:Heterokaryon incompatibility domain-containing protein n=1 Tax=Zasmidium cellare TaxID=395010 RepID=A0ABR0E6L3_ZASCE|nr:hypothetical protein PRZ48_011523 [Zasmidium cellare]
MDPPMRFLHEPLSQPTQQVRLLRFRKGGDDDMLAFDVITSDLGPAPEYFAVSYTWGDDLQDQVLAINDKVISVRQNCHYALWQIRSRYPDKTYVWIDFVCINQDDLEEKACQIQMMETIFTQARLVLVCVGPHADNSELVIDAVRRAKQHDPRAAEAASVVPLGDRTGQKFHDFMYGKHWEAWLDTLDDDHLANLNGAFQSFSQRKYWKRLWVVQEIAASKLAAGVLIGQDTLTWKDVDLLLQLMREVGRHGVKQRLWNDAGEKHWIYLWISKSVHNLHALSLSQAINFTYNRQCSDPRDHVYGILALVKWSKERIVPDYSKTPFDVAIETVVHLDEWISIWLMLHLVKTRDDARWAEIFTPWRERLTGEQGKTNVSLDNWQLERLCIALNGDSTCSQISATDHGLMTIPVKYDEQSSPERSERNKRIAAACMEAFHRCLQEDHSEPPKLLHYRENVVAIVCGDAQISDIVLTMWPGNPLLILRHHGEEFRIIGQGFLLPGLSAVYIQKRKQNPSHLTSRERDSMFLAKVHLTLSAGNMMRLVGQGMVDIEGPLWNVEDRVRQLANGRPLGTATVNIIEPKQAEGKIGV